MTIPKRTLGSHGPKIGAVGYGAMVLEGYYGPSDDDSIEVCAFGSSSAISVSSTCRWCFCSSFWEMR